MKELDRDKFDLEMVLPYVDVLRERVGIDRPMDFEELWEHHDNIGKYAPHRSVYWGLQKAREEADEWCFTDPTINEEQFLSEGADVVIAWMGAMKEAGFSYDVALESIRLKMNVVIDRVIEADILSRGGAMTFDTAYQNIKSLEKPTP